MSNTYRQTEHLFQFTPLREGRLLKETISFALFSFQFTPLREGRLFGVLVILGVVNISIHAPA